TRGEEQYQGQVFLRFQERGVVGNQLVSDSHQFAVVHGRSQVNRAAAVAKAGKMVVPAVELMTHRPAQVGDGGAHDETGVVQGQSGFVLAHPSAVVPSQWVRHVVLLVVAAPTAGSSGTPCYRSGPNQLPRPRNCAVPAARWAMTGPPSS